MFNSVSGKITEKRPGQLLLATGGIEWDVAMPESSLSGLPEAGAEARVFVYLYHRDDQMRLFGFASPEERTVFLELLKVDGVGPRQAMRILSGGSIEQLIAHLDEGDVDSLARFPGLGKKTAQKIVLALRGKLSLQPTAARGRFEEITAALTEMGFDRKQANEAVAAAAEEIAEQSTEEPSEEQLLKRAIVHLSGPERG